MTSRTHVYFMSVIAAAFVILYCSPFESKPWLVAGMIVFLFPAQILVWRLSYQRKAKDFFFCISFLALNLILKHYWQYSDSIFYATAVMMSAVLRYHVFLGISGSAAALEVLRENYHGAEGAEDVAFRYLLFFLTGSLTHLLLREEIKRRDIVKKELDDLRYGIHQVEETSESTSERAADAAVALEDALQKLLQLVHNIFKPDAVLFWQYFADKNLLRVRLATGDAENTKKDLVVPLGEGPVGWAALNQKAFFQQNREEGITYGGKKTKSSILSFLAVPVLEKDRLEGVITLESQLLNFFSPDAERSLSSFAAQMAETIRMARLAREREERAYEFQAFYRASKELASLIDFEEIIQKLHVLCAEIVSFEFSAVAIVNESGERYSLYEWTSSKEEAPRTVLDLANNGHTWISWFLTQREEPLILSESQLKLQEIPLMNAEEDLQDLVSFLAAPLRHQQRCIGALLLGSSHQEAFNSHQARIISILCNQAAVSLENSAIIQKMEELAITDGLTTLYNHRYFQEALQKEMERAERQKQNLSLLIMDIDHFKGFNDSFGHPAGDFVLKSLAQLLKQNARKVDVLARYGGEEFAALLPGIEIKNARKTAERWRKAVQRTSFKWENKSFAVTLSIGFATFPADANSKMDLIEKADRALYDAKENGRNQVRHHSDAESKPSRLLGF